MLVTVLFRFALILFMLLLMMAMSAKSLLFVGLTMIGEEVCCFVLFNVGDDV